MPKAPPVHRPPGWRPPAVAQREQTRQLGRETDRRRRDNPARALYKTARWRTLRAAQLAAHPLCQCEACDEGRRRIAPATVVDVSGGADIEADDDLRDRLLARIQAPPHGGNAADYEAWALQVPGVTRAWVYRHHMGAGTVGLAFVCDGRTDIVPTGAEVAAMAAHIDTLRPVTATVVVFAPVAAPLALTIRLNPDSAATRAAVSAELRDFLAREAVPGGTLYLSRLREAISQAAGEYRHELVAPAADVVSPAGRIATLGVITWLV